MKKKKKRRFLVSEETVSLETSHSPLPDQECLVSSRWNTNSIAVDGWGTLSWSFWNILGTEDKTAPVLDRVAAVFLVGWSRCCCTRQTNHLEG